MCIRDRAYAKRHELRDPERFRAWVCSIARRLALNYRRAHIRARNREERASSVPAARDVEAEAEDRAFLQSVRHAIDALPPKLRETLVLCAVEGLEPADVATMIGIPQGTVRSRPVSYTHLDVYKRQISKTAATARFRSRV